MFGEVEIQKSNGEQGMRIAQGLLKRFDLKELVDSRLCRIVTEGDERGLKFEYVQKILSPYWEEKRNWESFLRSSSAILGIRWSVADSMSQYKGSVNLMSR